ncbi:MAG: molybdopterin-binding protein [Saprospiraceae bacterium]
MNSLSGHISNIEECGQLSLVTVRFSATLILKAIVVETTATAAYLSIDRKIKMLFKETEVVVGTNAPHAISLQNRIEGTVQAIERGQLISKIKIATEVGVVVSIISTNAVAHLRLVENLPVVAMIKLNEMMLAE